MWQVRDMAEGHDRCHHHRILGPASSSPESSPCCSSTQRWLPAESPPRPRWNDHRMEQDEHSAQTSEIPSSHFYEELFCSSQTCIPLVPVVPLVPVAPAAPAASTWPQSDAVKQGYLGKQERNNRRYFVLRAGSHTGPSRLEWYKNQEKFTAIEKSAGKAVLFGSSKQGVIYLRCCLGVSRTGSSRKGHTVALYAKDQTMVMVVEDQQEQEEWYLAIKKLMEEERKDDEHGDGFSEDDDGYCTLPCTASFKEVWPVSVKPKGLGRSKSLIGETRLCLTATSLILVRVGACSNLPSVTIPLLSVRRFGHLDGSFFVELGRSAPDGPGEIWMEARDQGTGNPGIAQHIHEAIRETVQALRALPDFSRSPTSNPNQPQALLISKRSRPKYRDKPVKVRPLNSLQVQPPRNTVSKTSRTQSCIESWKTDKTRPESNLSITSHLSTLGKQLSSSSSEFGTYMEMKTEHCSVAACRVKSWEPGGQEEGLGYVMMSPQGSHSSSVLYQDDYVTMTSPHKHNQPPCSSPSSGPQTSFYSLSCENYSPVHPSHQQTSEHSQQHWQLTKVQQESGVGQPQTSISWSTRPADDVSRLGYIRPDHSSPISGTGRSSRLQADQSVVKRSRLSSCLLSCLQAEERS